MPRITNCDLPYSSGGRILPQSASGVHPVGLLDPAAQAAKCLKIAKNPKIRGF
jgi:hypothetical protein